MLNLLKYAAQEYDESSELFSVVDTMKEACKRLGIEYSPYGIGIIAEVKDALGEKEVVDD